MVTESDKQLIQCIVNVFETGIPEGKYDSLVVMRDGKNQSLQITYGRSQTTEQGNLKELLDLYVDKNGVFSIQLSGYLNRIGVDDLTGDTTFKSLLQRAGREDEIMKSAQDEFFDERYYDPARNFFTANGFGLALSMLVIYDSYIHSGGILGFLRKRFPD